MALLTNCKACMTAYSTPIRQGWGCGHELPPAPGVPVAPWSGCGYDGPAPTICPGYTTTLPETIEAARAWKWWSKGELAAFVDGAPVSGPLKIGIEVFDAAMGAFERWRMTPRERGGGAE